MAGLAGPFARGDADTAYPYRLIIRECAPEHLHISVAEIIPSFALIQTGGPSVREFPPKWSEAKDQDQLLHTVSKQRNAAYGLLWSHLGWLFVKRTSYPSEGCLSEALASEFRSTCAALQLPSR